MYCLTILSSASIVIHSVNYGLLRNQPRSDSCDITRLARKVTKGIHSCKPASLNCPIDTGDVILDELCWKSFGNPQKYFLDRWCVFLDELRLGKYDELSDAFFYVSCRCKRLVLLGCIRSSIISEIYVCLIIKSEQHLHLPIQNNERNIEWWQTAALTVWSLTTQKTGGW